MSAIPQVVIFGGSGFIGSHLADVLTKKGYDVTIFDRVVSPYLKDTQQMIVGDVLDEAAVYKAVEGKDIVYNFAGLADIERSNDDPLLTVKANVVGNMHILEASRREGIKRFVFASSVYVYSDAGSTYRCSKQACELFIENYQKEYNVDYTIVRYGSLYGPRCDENNWIYRILKQALLEQKIVREGDGEEIREYIHVMDAARLSAELLRDEYKNRCVIITGNEQIKIKDLMIMVREMFKGQIQLEFVPTRGNLHYEITPYVFKAQTATKIKSNEHIDLGQGLLHILEEIYHKNLKGQEKVEFLQLSEPLENFEDR